MPIWMRHPIHGRTPAVGSEVDWNLKNGWVIEKPNSMGILTGSQPVADSNKKDETLRLPNKGGRPKGSKNKVN